MSKSTFGWRQAGFTAVATALVFGGTLVGAGAASAAIANPAIAISGTAATVLQGANNQAASNVNYSFDNAFTSTDTIAFSIQPNGAPNVCVAGADPAAVGFSVKPTVTAAKGVGADANVVVPTFTTSFDSSSTDCVDDILIIDFTSSFAAGSTNVAANDITLAITGIQYNVGASAPLEDVFVDDGTTAVANATVTDRDFTSIPRQAATPNSDNNALGDVTYTETTAGAFFKENQVNTVTLTLDGGTVFTDNVTPTISAPSGYDVTRGETDGTNEYEFTIETPVTLVKAVVTVAGLRADAGADVEVVSLDTEVADASVVPVVVEDTAPALNVVKYGNSNRIGGQTRYDTAAALFNAGPGGDPAVNADDVAVLSGGEEFPDALSANYLASSLDTGTLLTTAKTLSPAARNAIIDNLVDTVYITGGFTAVSKAIEDQIETMRVGGRQAGNLIQTVRLGGANRYITNQTVNNFAENLNAAATPTVLLSSGAAFPDALAFGPIAYSESYPLVLTPSSVLGAQASSQLDAFNPDDVVISGGTAAVSAGVASSVSATGADVARLGGVNRNETATMIAEWATEGSPDAAAGSFLEDPLANFDSATVNFTWTNTPQGFGDALAAGPLAGDEGSVILLAATSTTPGDAVTDYLGLKLVDDTDANTNVGIIRPLGGTTVTAVSLIKASAASIED